MASAPQRPVSAGAGGAAASSAFTTTRLPGGTAPILAMLGAGPLDPQVAALAIIRILYAAPPRATADTWARYRRIDAYLSRIEELDREINAIGAEGISLASAAGSGAHRRHLERLARILGLEVRQAGKASRVLLDESSDGAAFREAFARAGVDPTQVVTQLNAGEVVRLRLAADLLPLPLGASAWRTTVLHGRVEEGQIAVAILRNRDAALLYFGASAWDAATRSALASTPGLLGSLGDDRAGRVAAFGRSIRIADGRVQVPGGTEAAPLWEALVGKRPTDVQAFVSSLLDRDQGAAAYLYDTLAHLDPARLRYALGLWIPDAGQRLDRFTALYRVFVAFGSSRQVGTHPFTRRTFDPAIALLILPVGRDGEPPPAAWRRMWSEAFVSTGLPEAGQGPRAESEAPADAAWLLEQVLAESVSVSRDRMDAVLFSWRVFSRTNAMTAAPGDVFAALRGFSVFPTLMLTLEQAGIARPDLYAAACRTADRLTFHLADKESRQALVQFQGALALVARARFRHRLDQAAAESLVASLLAVSPDRDGHYAGQMCRWLSTAFIPAVAGERSPPGAVERVVLRALAGPEEATGAPGFEWDGESFRVDLTGGELGRLERVRARQGTNSLDAVLAFWRAAEAVRGGATSVDDVRQLAEDVSRAATELQPITPGALLGAVDDALRTVRNAVEDLGKVQRQEDLDRLPGLAGPLLVASDALLADTLAAVVYAVSSGDDDSRVALAGNPARLHDLTAAGDSIVTAPAPWRVPEEVSEPGEPWHARYSLLALDVALARHTLPRLFDAPPPHPPTLPVADQHSFSVGITFVNPFDLTDAGQDEIAAAIARGRARLARVAAQPEWNQVARDAGLDEWRREAVARTAAGRPGGAEALLSLVELMRIGQPDPSVDLEPWGANAMAIEGCLCVRQPLVTGWEGLAGRMSAGLLPAHLSDLGLQVAAHLAALHAPARLGRVVLAYVARDFLQNVALAHDGDWLAGVEQARRLPKERVEEVLTLLTTNGVLATAGGPQR